MRKVRQIGDTLWYALIAGDPTFALQVIDGTEEILTNRPDLSRSVQGMMNALKAAYKKRRELLVNDLVLSPRLLTKELLVARPKGLLPLDQEFFIGVSNEAKSLRTNSSLLVCGFDTSFHPHIFSVVPPGTVKSHDMTGLHAVGIGATMAISRLLVLESLKEDPLPLALYQAFDSKVNAEVMEGVGYNWDAEILVGGKKAVEVPGSVRNLVESVYECLPLTPLELRKRQKARKYPREWKARLDKFCNRVMQGARRSESRHV